MPARIALEPEAIAFNGTSEADCKASHDRFFEVWERFGVLVVPEDKDSLNRAIERLPQSYRKKWKNALKSSRFRVIEKDLPDFSGINVEADLLAFSEKADLVSLEDARGVCVCISDENYSKVYEEAELEVCRFAFLDRSHAVTSRKDAWDTLIYKGERREDIWKNKFSGLCRYAKRISLIDRYAGKNLIKSFGKGEVSGVEIFLRRLSSINECIDSKTINLFVSDEETEKNALVRTMSKVLEGSRRNVRSFHVHICPDKIFGAAAHDRFVRFDNLITALGKGLSVFEDETCQENYSCQLFIDRDEKFRNEVEGFIMKNSHKETLI